MTPDCNSSTFVAVWILWKYENQSTTDFRVLGFAKLISWKNAISTKLWWIYWSRYQDLKWMVQDSTWKSFSILVFMMFRRVVFSRNRNDYSSTKNVVFRFCFVLPFKNEFKKKRNERSGLIIIDTVTTTTLWRVIMNIAGTHH